MYFNHEVFTRLSSLQIQVHWATAVAAFVLGLVIFSLPKGTRTHKVMGWTYVALMLTTATAAIFIRTYAGGEGGMPSLMGFSQIHLFVPLTFFGIGGALIAIRRKNVRAHRGRMIGTFVGALLIAGFFTFMPGRRMWALFFGEPEWIEAWLRSAGY